VSTEFDLSAKTSIGFTKRNNEIDKEFLMGQGHDRSKTCFDGASREVRFKHVNNALQSL
jgi:hypothetical protein